MNSVKPKGRTGATPELPWRRMLSRAAGLLALSSVLGFAFNASNPLGVRFDAAETPVARPASNAVPSAALSPVASLAPAANATSAPVTTTQTAHSAGGLAPESAVASTSPVTWAEIKPSVEKGEILLVDARNRAAFDAGHIPGAISVPEDSPPPELQTFRDQYGTNRHVVVYCSSTSCSLSFKLAYKLVKDYGFRRVQYMTGGYQEWQRDAGLAPAVASAPLLPSIPPGVPPGMPLPTTAVGGGAASSASTPALASADGTVSQANPHPISWEKVDEWLQDRRALLVDVRSEEDYRAGHVPGAISVPDNSSPKQLAAFRKMHGTNRPVILYGDMGGSMKAFAFGRQLTRQEGFTAVRFVTEGYKEWRAKQLPSPPAK